MANGSSLEVFDPDSHTFVGTDSYRFLDINDFLGSDPVELPHDREVFADLKIYDTSQTVLNALTCLARRQPNCYVGLANVIGTLRKVALSGIPVRPVVDVSLPLFSDIPDVSAWEQMHVAEALGVGCVGVLVSVDNSYLAELHSSVPFFRVSRQT